MSADTAPTDEARCARERFWGEDPAVLLRGLRTPEDLWGGAGCWTRRVNGLTRLLLLLALGAMLWRPRWDLLALAAFLALMLHVVYYEYADQLAPPAAGAGGAAEGFRDAADAAAAPDRLFQRPTPENPFGNPTPLDALERPERPPAPPLTSRARAERVEEAMLASMERYDPHSATYRREIERNPLVAQRFRDSLRPFDSLPVTSVHDQYPDFLAFLSARPASLQGQPSLADRKEQSTLRYRVSKS